MLLGPSGCGKTTTLRCLAGLETPDAGADHVRRPRRLRLGDEAQPQPDKRNIGMVFQSYALWPHMTVRKNIGYPLQARKLRRPGDEGLGRGDGRARRLLGSCSTATPPS